MEKIIGICCDHAGYALKNELTQYLSDLGYTVKNFGTDSEESCDYPDFSHPMANAIEKGEFPLGISICGTGNGINMTTNKHQSIRAALCWNAEISELARSHNNANVCSLPARFINTDLAKSIIAKFLDTPFEGGRHQTRIDKIPISTMC